MFNRVKCFYCNCWTQKPKTAKKQPLRQFKCQHCTAVNFLDEKGKITDPPLRDVLPSTPQPIRYAHAGRGPAREQPSPSKVFCNTCLKNQHMLYENLRELDAVSKDEDPKKWHQQQLYVQELEERYPQVCAECRPKARAAIKRANYFTRSWNMMISMQKTKSGQYSPVSQGRWWRSTLMRCGQIGRETSVLGQAVWHLLGARMIVQNAAEPALGAEQPANSSSAVAKIISCSAQAVTSDGVNPYCFVDLTPWMTWVLALGLLTLWWNNKLRQKYLDRKPGRMTGTRDYYLLQLVSLAIRAVAWYFLQSPRLLASSSGIEHLSNFNTIYRSAHFCMIAFIGFVELISRTIVQLNNRYQVKVIRDEDILPDTPLPTRVSKTGQNLQQAAPASSNSPAWLRKQPGAFDISSLSSSLNARPAQSDRMTQSIPQPQYAAPVAPPTPPLDEPMEWSPTEPSFATSSFQARASQNSGHNLRPRKFPQDMQPVGASPFSQPPPQAQPSRLTYPQAPVQQSSFHTQSTVQHKTQPWEAEPSDTAQNQGHSSGSWTKQRSDFSMAQPSFFLERDKIDTGLESIFNDVFTLHDDSPAPTRRQRNSPQRSRPGSSEGSPGRGHGGMFGPQWEEPVQTAQPSKSMDAGVLLIVAVPVLIMGAVIAVVKGWVDADGLLRSVKGESLQHLHGP